LEGVHDTSSLIWFFLDIDSVFLWW
jgi:hypothetical protein